MKRHQKKTILAWFCVGWLLVSCAQVTTTESGKHAEPVDMQATEKAANKEQTDEQPQDIIDRALSPLDNAVSDINRDLNKGDADTPSEPDN